MGQTETDVEREAKAAAVMPWARPYFRFANFIDDATKIASLHAQGMHQILGRKQTLEIIAGVGEWEGKFGQLNPPTAEQLANIENMRQAAEDAQAELDSGHDLLFAHLLVGIWGAFESFVEDFAAVCLRTWPDLLQRSQIAKIKISLADYYSLDTDDDKMHYVVNELQRAARSDSKRGVEQFEALLEGIGKDGAIDPNIKRQIYVAQQVRHVFAHRAGIADRKLVAACPNEGFTLGERVRVTKDRFDAWTNALTSYGLVIIVRCMDTAQRQTLVDTRSSSLPHPYEGFLSTSFPDEPLFAGT